MTSGSSSARERPGLLLLEHSPRAVYSDATVKIEILTSDRALTPCVWDEVPEFVILTGANGVGKSQFLSAIQRHYGEVGYRGLSVSWSDGPIDADDVLFSGADWGVASPGPKSIVWLADQRESLNHAYPVVSQEPNPLGKSGYFLRSAFA